MHRLNRLARALVVALAVFQAGAPPLLALADATVGPNGAVTAHIEDHTQRNCLPVHPDHCALCRALSLVAAPGATMPESASRQGAMHVRVARACGTPASGDVRLHHSRAPPAN